MGLLDDAMNAVSGGGQAQSGGHASAASAVMSMLSNNQGGISGLAEQFAAKGLGHVINSWISTGHNLPVTPEQIQSVLGNQQVQAFAAKAGIPHGQGQRRPGAGSASGCGPRHSERRGAAPE